MYFTLGLKKKSTNDHYISQYLGYCHSLELGKLMIRKEDFFHLYYITYLQG
jgi:hypothetical protein